MANLPRSRAQIVTLSATVMVAGSVFWCLDTENSSPPPENVPLDTPSTQMAWTRRPPVERQEARDATSITETPANVPAEATRPSAPVPEGLAELAESAPVTDLPAIFERFLRLGNSVDADALRHRVLERLCESEPKQAAQFATRLPAGLARDAALDMIAAAYSNYDFDAAMQWAEEFPVEKDRLLTQIAYEASRNRPMDALGIAAELAETPTRDDLIRHAAMQWATVAPLDAAAWTRDLSNPLLREQVAGAVATAWANSEPSEAARFAIEVMPVGRPRDNAVIGIVQRWAQKEPDAASAWVGAFPEGELKNSAQECLSELTPVTPQ